MSIEVRNLRFSYRPGDPVLQDVTFRIADGRMACLLGKNGVGKSTLFKTILRLLQDYQGEIYINEHDTCALSVKEMAEHVAYIPQSYPPTFNYSVFEMVLMGTTAGLTAFRAPKKEQREIAEQAMERLKISHLRERGFAEISGGERQLTLIARALAQQTSVLIMDEPTANLDYGNAIRVLEQIKELAGTGYTILQATHQPDQAFLFADEVIALSEGKVLAQGAPNDTITREFIRTLYDVQVDVESLHDDEIRVCVPVMAIREGKTAAPVEE